MSVEKIDFAIYGSDVDAAFLAAELVRLHDAKVLLIRDQVNDYSLHHLQAYSVSAFCEPDTLLTIENGRERWQSQFTGRAGRECFERVELALRVGDQLNQDLLHYVEGSMIAVDRQCQRMADASGVEHLSFRNVVAPARKNTLEFIHNKFVGSGLSIFDRTYFESAKRQKGGPLVLRSTQMRYEVRHSVFLDMDLVQSQSNVNKNSILKSYKGSEILVKSNAPRSRHAVHLDRELEIRPYRRGQMLVKCQGEFNDLVRHAETAIDQFLEMMLVAQGSYQGIATTDGSPMFAKLNAHQSIFVGGKHASVFLMPSAARCKKDNQ